MHADCLFLCVGRVSDASRWFPPAVYCVATNFSALANVQAAFSATLAGTNGVGSCNPGLFGLPQIQCQLNGQWNTTSVLNPCSGRVHRCALWKGWNAALKASAMLTLRLVSSSSHARTLGGGQPRRAPRYRTTTTPTGLATRRLAPTARVSASPATMARPAGSASLRAGRT